MNEDTINQTTPQRQEDPRANFVSPDTSAVTGRTETPPSIREAIVSIRNYRFDPDEDERKQQEELAAYMMLTARGTTELPTLTTEGWPYSNDQLPNPISICKARELLAIGYEAIDCDIDGSGIHGHAWIIEKEEEWLKRDDVERIIAPTKPKKVLSKDIIERLNYADQLETYKLYHHLAQEGNRKLLEWFGKAMFVDLYVRGKLPAAMTPSEMLDHLASTYAQSKDYRRHMEHINKEFLAAYDPKQPVEKYFMRLQQARDDAELLGRPYTEQQSIDQGIAQIEKQYKDAWKAEKKWNEESTRDWDAFKIFWKREVHQWQTVSKDNTKHANQVQVDSLTNRMNHMQIDLSALQAENQSYKTENSALMAKHIEFTNALQTEHERRLQGDDLSTITGYLSGIDRRIAGLEAGHHSGAGTGTTTTQTMGTMSNDRGSRRDPQERLRAAKQRSPDTYREHNGGNGLTFSRYCWKCGCNCTHWTRQCYELDAAQKARYKEANFENTMGGNQRFIERRGRAQRDFNFDSL
jgi:hypothetical protein